MSTLNQLWDDHGQAVWLDFIQRSLLSSGGLERWVREHGIRGVTSNPSIFCQAIGGSTEYDRAVHALLADDPAMSTVELYEALAIDDIRGAADVLRAVYDASDGGDGYVSLEVSPRLARDTAATIDEARRLFAAVDRANLMIKVPATAEGIPAIEALIADGINVNATLMFSLEDYEAVARAYIAGLERCAEPERVASVASFFVSRVDTVVDARLEAIGTSEARALRGTAAIANAGLAYRRFREIFHGSAFAALRSRGGRVQRPLWASTSTKNPAYRDVLYIEGLVAAETVNTVPMATLDAFRDHGRPRASLDEGLATAEERLAAITALGIDLDAVTRELQVKGVDAFAASFDELLETLEARRRAVVEGS